ncbi:hypothetical protein CsSME_00007017 [Camellia sinensis var. sinensis]
MGQFPHHSLLSLSQKHGPLMLLQFGSMLVLVISFAQAAQEIIKTHDLTFSDRPKLRIASKLLYEAWDVGFALWRVLEADEELMCAAAPKQQAGKVFLCCERRRNGPYDREDQTIMFFFIFNNGEFEQNVSVAYEWCRV